LKNVKLILASFCLVLVGCSDDDDPVAANSCTTSLMTYSENASGLFDGTATQEECEAAYTALMEYCADGCEADDAEDGVCSDDMDTWDAAAITELCGGTAETFTLSGTFNYDSMMMYTDSGCSENGESMDVSSYNITITFNEDGTLVDPEGEAGTYTCSSATTCAVVGGPTLTVNSDGTVTSTESWEAYCADSDDDVEYDSYTTEADCTANGSADGAGDGVWWEAGCSVGTWSAASGS